MKTELLRLLFDKLEHQEYLSGQEISELLQCSRTAIWKHINQLKDAGFEIESIRNRGYRLIREPDQISQHAVLARLKTDTMFQRIIHKEVTSSTQDDAMELIQSGAANGTVVISDAQTKGRGRLGRDWHSGPDGGLWFSMIVKPEIPVHRAPQLTLITGVALVRVLNRLTEQSGTFRIKWPNDILADHLKTAGILTEMHADPDRVRALMIGVGINVNQVAFPDWLAGQAESLAGLTGETLNRNVVLSHFLTEFEYWYQLFLAEGISSIKTIWEANALPTGHKVSMYSGQTMITGKTLGITDEGVMQLIDDDGKVHELYSANLEWNDMR
ncbi:biotin--[acetyl-CoA-carboxylase] ligase [Salisediminibacterium beveridgei]|uniref:Bifunctional ligase/repressor BirA n=1 Tax=Salisediminibacterium beveridgei TaxID=632773 RepID=A0A1D7QUY8_9BACI|nr:biotin--[acetyl-CoA-carboxylase] ligase [Salisediminibacterium beveridgei]AOM82833.1 Biotin-protein ligase / Biotin operon repressor [Salisediminibacterium beveridgei]